MALRPYEDIWSLRRRRHQVPFFTPAFSSGILRSTDEVPSRDWITNRYRDERMVEIERKFDEMVRKVDSRFSGIFSLLDDNETFGKRKIAVEHEGKQSDSSNSTMDFSLKIDVQDFKPEEVKVKVQNGQVFVHAKRENKNEGDGMYAYCFREFRKAFAVPKDINIEKITSNLSSDGILQVEAPANGPLAGTIEGSIPVVIEHSDIKT